MRRRGGGLALSSTSGELRLPLKELDGWKIVTAQVEEWLEQLQQRQTPKLVAIDGTPGRQGVTFIFCAQASAGFPEANGIWLDPQIALPTYPHVIVACCFLANPSWRRPKRVPAIKVTPKRFRFLT